MPSKNAKAAERAHIKLDRHGKHGDAGEGDRQMKKRPGGSAQVLDKARFGQGNGDILVEIQAFPFLLDLARLCWIWPNLAQFGFRLNFPWMLYVTHRRHEPHP
jgi:hypothetical protein